MDVNAAATATKSRQLCSTLCDPIDGSLPGSAVPGIFQARVLEWGAIAFSVDANEILFFFKEYLKGEKHFSPSSEIFYLRKDIILETTLAQSPMIVL